MDYHIYGNIEGRVITFIGCVKDIAQVPASAVILQTVSNHAQAHWVKWSLRHRRTLKDKTALSNPLTEYFENPSRLKRLLADAEFKQLIADRNQAFLKYHAENPHVLDEMLSDARSEKASGRKVYTAQRFVHNIRWGNTNTVKTDQFKINENWTAWYARAIQMVDPSLAGFFKLKTCTADGLVWIDGQTWAQFAHQNAEKLNWADPWEEFPDSDWEHHE